MEFRNCSFNSERVELDGNSYTNVRFTNCKMVFKASSPDPLSLVGCGFDGCTWHFEGAAGNTINFINTLAQGMGPGYGRKFLKSLFKNNF